MDEDSLSVVRKGRIKLQKKPTYQILDTNLHKRFTRSQAIELDQVVKRFEALKMYGDEDENEPEGDVVNYAFISRVDIEPYKYALIIYT